MGCVIDVEGVVETVAVQAQGYVSGAELPGYVDGFPSFVDGGITRLRVLMTERAEGKAAVLHQIGRNARTGKAVFLEHTFEFLDGEFA